MITSGGVIYDSITCSKYVNPNGSYYIKDAQVTVAGINVNNPPKVIQDGDLYENEKYEVFTLAANDSYKEGSKYKSTPHSVKANKDCVVNFMLIASGAPGCTSGASDNLSSGPGGNAGSVISGSFPLKTGERYETIPYTSYPSSYNNRYAVDTLKYMGQIKNPSVIGGDIRTREDGNNTLTSQDATLTIFKNDGRVIVITAGGAYWPVASKHNNITVGPSYNHSDKPTLPCSIVGAGDIDIQNYYPSKVDDLFNSNEFLTYTIHRSRPGGCTRFNTIREVPYNQGFIKTYPSCGLASGYDWEDVQSTKYTSKSIMGNDYILPCGGGGGGGYPSSIYTGTTFSQIYDFYNITVINYQIKTESIPGSATGGGGFGNTIDRSEEMRYIDAWLPGAGGGGAFQNNKNVAFTNGYGGQGVMLCWIKY